MSEIVLTTLNAKYIHSSFGLRYLMANMGDLGERTAMVEFEVRQRSTEIVEKLLAFEPKIIGFGVYIWNAKETEEVVSALKRVRPDIVLILGGPEVSYEIADQTLLKWVDFVIQGEGDLKFSEVCRSILGGASPEQKIISAELPQLENLKLPYKLYTEEDLAHRVIYVEASRGCPFTCEFCLSSLDIPVRQFPLESLLEHFQRLMERGATHFKFVDRTFNLNLQISQALLQFFLERYHPGLFLHFEMVPDRLPESLRMIIEKFPLGALQFEVGIQSFNPEVGQRIKRRQNFERLEENFQFLRNRTGVHIHADLIVGLPGESLESFARGFDRLVGLHPQEIQVGILKRLRGTPIVRHDQEWEMVYHPSPPYEILQNKLIPFSQMQRMRRFARYWDLTANSGHFLESTPLLWSDGGSPFEEFMGWSDWLYSQVHRTDQISLLKLTEQFVRFLVQEKGLNRGEVVGVVRRDYQRTGRIDVPGFLLESEVPMKEERMTRNRFGQRQTRHRLIPVETPQTGRK